MRDPRNRRLLAVLVVTALALSAIEWWAFAWTPIVAWLIGWSAATFAAYGIDKAQAARRGWRIPELGLHGLALAGGAAGGWLGMLVFRHKIRHGSFIAVLAVATIVQVGLVLALATAA